MTRSCPLCLGALNAQKASKGEEEMAKLGLFKVSNRRPREIREECRWWGSAEQLWVKEPRKEVTGGRCEGVIDVGPCVCMRAEGGNSESLHDTMY